MHTFYTPAPALPVHTLEGEEAEHAVRVLRVRPGDRVECVDGRGGRYLGAVEEVTKRTCSLRLDAPVVEPALTPALVLVVAPTKSTDRFEWMLEKATELGVSAVQPVWTARSERRQEKLDRWERILVAAMKQSRQAYLPELRPAMAFTAWCAGPDAAAAPGYIAHCMPGTKPHLLAAVRAAGTTSAAWVAIGPEGDFTAEEVAAAESAGAVAVSLGTTRLRTETAGVAAVHAFRLAAV
jgi:16S rRNA (uracil1498-N3)-methyltransferase